MARTVFFSWQSDRGRQEQDLIEAALELALARIAADASVEPAIRSEGLEIDRDTKGVGGSPPIVETIFAKIDGATVFVADMTYVAKRETGRPAPNPNVLIEYGWALKSVGHGRILPVMNSHFGAPTPDTMPFDMRHLRFPIEFNLPRRADSHVIKQVRVELSKKLEENLRVIFQTPGVVTVPATPSPFPSVNVLERSRRSISMGKSYGLFGRDMLDVQLRPGPVFWLNLRPKNNTGKSWSTGELKTRASSPNISLYPLASFGRGTNMSYFRGEDGFGLYIHSKANEPTASAVYVTEAGEIWGMDTYNASIKSAIFLPSQQYVHALDQYRAFLTDKLNLKPPFHLELGIEDMANQMVWLPELPGKMYIDNPVGSCISNRIIVTETIDEATHSKEALAGFFQAILDKCGVDNPEVMRNLFDPNIAQL